MRTLIIGAGPIGVEAALAALARGHDVRLVDAERVGASLMRWGSTRFFSPFRMNVSPRFKEILGVNAPGEDALLTGPEMVSQALLPVSKKALGGKFSAGVRVVAVGRKRMTRRDRPDHPLRHEKPFTVLWENNGVEERHEFDLVLDASGNAHCNNLGIGGLPALGERAAADNLVRTLGGVQDGLASWEGQRLLLVGHGHSAACALVSLGELAQSAPKTQVVWATRSRNRKPCQAVASDPLPERSRTVDQANAWAHQPPEWLEVRRKTHVMSVEAGAEGFEVGLSDDTKQRFDAVLAFTGHHPDTSLESELQVRLSPVTGGALGIHAALSNVTDCLSVPQLEATDLASGEPGFYLLGSKSYGRMSTFLLKDGIQQIDTVLDAESHRG